MMESMKRMITKTGRNGEEVRTCDDTRQQLDRRKPEWKGKETAERSSSEDRGTVIEIEGEHVTE